MPMQPLIHATHHMVSSGHHLATQAGYEGLCCKVRLLGSPIFTTESREWVRIRLGLTDFLT